MTAPLPPLLHLDGVSHRYRRSRGICVPRGVHDVDLQVAAGERVGLVGASGAGKTTIAHLATGLLAPDAGRVLLGGTDRRSLDRRVVGGRVHLVSQDPYTSLAPHARVRWLVAEPLLVRQRDGSSDARVRAALAEVGLTPVERFLDRFPHELSGGQRQRVALARALVARPALVVADEPTQMLDVLARRDLLDLIDHIGTETAWLYITHDLALAGVLCDRLVVVHEGRVVEEGPTDAVLTAPASEPARALVEAVRLLSR